MNENKKVFTSGDTGESFEVTLEVITPEKAEKYLALNRKNRKKNERVFSMYRRDMENNRWKITGETIKFLKDGSLCDGQNRLIGCIRSGVPFETFVIRGISLEAMKAIDAGKTRTVKDYFDFEGIQYSTEITSGARKYLILSGGSTTAFNTDRNNSKKLSVSEVYKEYESHKEIYSDASRFSAYVYKKSNLLSKATVVALIRFLVGDKNYSEERVKNFFLQLADEKPACSSVRLLRKKLMEDKENRVKRLSGYVRQVYITKAWNAFATGKELRKITYNQGQDENLEFV